MTYFFLAKKAVKKSQKKPQAAEYKGAFDLDMAKIKCQF